MKYVALLRGINVGGDRKVDMKQLKTTFEGMGLGEVRTYINSGNVIFSAKPGDARNLKRALERAIKADFGFPVTVLLRDATEMAALLEELPDNWANDDAAKCDVIFLGEDVDAPEVLEQLVIKPDIDDVHYIPGAVLWRVERPNVTRSGLTKLVGTELYAQTTVRNCNTVRKLAELMR
jgi:uncharacterized protein (DUF1697 family)